MLQAPDGEVFGVRWFYDRGDEDFVWVMVEPDERQAPRDGVERFMAATGLDRALLVGVNSRWTPPGGWRGERVGWGRLDVSEDGRTLTLRDPAFPQGGDWFVREVEVVERDDAVEVELHVSNDADDDGSLEVRLERPLGTRAILDRRLGRLVRPRVPPEDAHLEAVPWESAEATAAGLVVVRWHAPMTRAFAGIDVEHGAGEVTLTVRVWRRGGRLGGDRRVAVIEVPGVTPSTRLVDGAR